MCLLNIRNLEAQEVLIAKKVISFTYGTAAFYTVMPGISILLTYDAGQAIGWSVLQSAISVLLLPSMYAIVLSEFILRPLKSKSEISAFEPLA
ncbi:hypothetical protein [Pseudoalteromonas shioyasakiensis]|uniref:hypothetical protein n=1 Tax=Pseudoalteromonas shioyasakiensis TaxID=1190813 RepID=UPI0021178B32|nr:hypothetical protein [Pseudoalteromonas shioyasakiensis]